jgi:hypothetical protein
MLWRHAKLRPSPFYRWYRLRRPRSQSAANAICLAKTSRALIRPPRSPTPVLLPVSPRKYSGSRGPAPYCFRSSNHGAQTVSDTIHGYIDVNVDPGRSTPPSQHGRPLQTDKQNRRRGRRSADKKENPRACREASVLSPTEWCNRPTPSIRYLRGPVQGQVHAGRRAVTGEKSSIPCVASCCYPRPESLSCPRELDWGATGFPASRRPRLLVGAALGKLLHAAFKQQLIALYHSSRRCSNCGATCQSALGAGCLHALCSQLASQAQEQQCTAAAARESCIGAPPSLPWLAWLGLSLNLSLSPACAPSPSSIF